MIRNFVRLSRHFRARRVLRNTQHLNLTSKSDTDGLAASWKQLGGSSKKRKKIFFSVKSYGDFSWSRICLVHAMFNEALGWAWLQAMHPL
jgi:hypothetical protein